MAHSFFGNGSLVALFWPLFGLAAVARTVEVLTAGYTTGQLGGPLVSSASVSLFHSLQPALLLAA
ncbi:hypothetical protein [Candidatus Pantoea persica]|uniref:hypothetical protein n=1 Tax=Candidatus Pantoea persica TaxID=2518128 RepID=UPI00215D8011|nr:hypothetical protein [Candidatus Pantoea persica]MBA2814037.1 MFS transporter [Candidatus Pantoea persica]